MEIQDLNPQTPEPASNRETVLAAAYDYIRRGWNVIPIPSGSKKPVLSGWQNLRLIESDVASHFTGNENIGLILGEPSGWLIDVDLDCLEAVQLADHFLPPTPMIHGRPGNLRSHRWYTCRDAKYVKLSDPVDRKVATAKAERNTLIELRTTGHQTVVPPSRYSTTEQLRWEGNLTPAEVDNTTLRAAVHRVGAGAMLVKRWVVGVRHNLALALAGAFAHGDVSKDEALTFIEAVCTVADDEESPDRRRAVENTYNQLAHGQPVKGCEELTGLLGKPVVDRLYEWLGLKRKILKSTPNIGPDERRLGLTDVGNVERLVSYSGDRIRFVKAWGWLIWDGRRWARDEDGAIYRLAVETVRKIYHEAGECADLRDRDNLTRHAQRSESRPRLEAMVKLAENHAEVAMKPDQFDRHPWRINFENGTLDLKTGEIKPHERVDFITKLAPVEYDPDATCPLFLAFLDHIFNKDEGLTNFVQKAFGYSLTGSTREQVIFVLLGNGSNGKSTLLSTILDLLGEDYAQQGKADTFLQRKYEGISNDIARMRGARIVSMVEVGEAARLNEPLIKSVTGGEPLVARFLYKDLFQFSPEFKLFLAVNHKPTIRGTDHGIWRRIRLIPFSVTIPDNQCDRDFPAKLKAERAGILAWLVKGCRKYLDDGLKPPKIVEDATKEYRTDMDVVGQFLDDWCMLGNDKRASAYALYEAYTSWCRSTGEYTITQKKFGMSLKEKGYVSGRDRNGSYWTGLCLKPAEAPPEQPPGNPTNDPNDSPPFQL